MVKLLGVEDCFDGMTFCDYAEGDELVCKPKPTAYERAMEEAGVRDKAKCYFVDDSKTNCEGAERFGWGKVVFKIEPEDEMPKEEERPSRYVVKRLEELRGLFPDLFKKEEEQ